MNIKGRTAFITGGAKRIGADICRFFVEKGCNICIVYHTSEKEAKDLKNDLLKFRVKIMLYKCDLTNTKESLQVFQNAISDFGKIDFLINNASIFKRNSLLNLTDAEFKRDNRLHFKTPLFLMQAFAKQNFDKHEGNIINIIDKNVIKNTSNFTTYIFSKKSLLDLTKLAAVQLAPKIRVNAISPGFIIEEEGSQPTLEYYQKKYSKIPLNKKGEIWDIINGIEFLINSTYITGENLMIDGGSFLV